MKNLMSINKLKRLLIFLFFISLITSVVIFGNVSNVDYKNIYFLPLLFSFFILMIIPVVDKLKFFFVFWVILTQLIIRYILIPIFFIFKLNLIAGNNSTYVEEAIFMYFVELVVFYLVFLFVAFKFDISKNTFKILKIENINITVINVSFLLLIILLFIVNVSFFEKIHFIWNLNDYAIQKAIGEDTEINASPIVQVLFPAFRAFIILFLISWINNSHLKFSMKIFMIILVISINATIIVGTSRLSILFAIIPLIIYIFKVYPKFKKGIGLFFGILFALIIVVSTISKFAKVDDSVYTNEINIIDGGVLNAYFSGIGNYAESYELYETTHVPVYDRFTYLKSEFFQNIPLLTSFSDERYQITRLLNDRIYGVTRTNKDQISPVSISGLYYFSSFFFYIPIVFFAILAFIIERKAYIRNDNVCVFFFRILLALNLSLMLMLSIGSIFSQLILISCVIIPLFKILFNVDRLLLR